MKKNWLKVLGIVALLSLSGCGEESSSPTISTSENESTYISTGSEQVSTNESNPSIVETSTSSSEEVSTSVEDTNEMNFIVHVVYEDNTPVVDSSITGQWCDDGGSCTFFQLDDTGSATKKLVKQRYKVHLFNLPDGYTYDSNAHYSDESHPEISVTIYHANDYYSDVQYNTSDGLSSFTPYLMLGEGYYLSQNKNNNMTYYAFIPQKPGVYSIESLADDIDVNLSYFGNNRNFVLSTPSDSDDDSGKEKNFKFEFDVSLRFFTLADEVDEQGNMLYAKDDQGNYIATSYYIFGITVPKGRIIPTFGIRVQYEREYVEQIVVHESKDVSENLTPFADNVDPDSTLKPISLDGSMQVFYNESDRYYHLNNENGPLVLVNINQPSTYISCSISHMEDEVDTFTFLKELTDEKITYISYTNFVAQYSRNCNADGVYPATKELKEFLILLNEAQSYFVDGGWISSQLNYEVPSECEWLFACYYYGSMYETPLGGDGSSNNPYQVQFGKYRFAVQSGQTIHLDIQMKEECKVVIKSATIGAQLTYLNETIGGAKGFECLTTLSSGSNMVSLSMAKNQSGTIIIDILEDRFGEPTGDRNGLILGINAIEIYEDEEFSGVDMVFVPETSGTYTITTLDDDSFVSVNGETEISGKDYSVTFTFEAGEEVFLNIMRYNFDTGLVCFRISLGE